MENIVDNELSAGTKLPRYHIDPNEKNGPFLCLKIKIKLVELQNQKTCLKTSRYEEENGFFLNSRIRSGNFIHNFNFDFCFAENLSCLSLGRCCGGS